MLTKLPDHDYYHGMKEGETVFHIESIEVNQDCRKPENIFCFTVKGRSVKRDLSNNGQPYEYPSVMGFVSTEIKSMSKTIHKFGSGFQRTIK